ncbi:hypothetical protein AALP_AA2G033300 [Arabis alpina]|uniref:Uncharacterized protein n=1 Tax=Arabis alpina TaxID=50452 RepID=A0A087HF25_ARAAL|nr:hypothetical protein AALP_AA2G033300 [Arabis alpina]
MGCCVSSGTKDNENDSDKNHPTIVEEETVVKEVLSETTFLTTIEDPVKTKEEILKLGHDSGKIRPDSIDPEEGSEASEICSLSLSESVSSTVVMNGYDEEEVKQRKSQRSPAKSRTRVTGNNYPTRRTDQSPRKRNNGVASSNGAKFGSGIRDPGERSGRRSRSPATNRSVMDSNQSRVGGARTRKNNQSPGRVRLDPNKNGSDQQQQYQNYGYTTEELLENPLVSLECFIFL